jgi:hypothetical protein
VASSDAMVFTLAVVAGAYAWFRGFGIALRRRQGVVYGERSMHAGAFLLAAAFVIVWPDRVAPPTDAEGIAQGLYVTGGLLLLLLGGCGMATGGQALSLHNLTTEPLVFVDSDGHARFTLHPEPLALLADGPRPEQYFIVARDATHLVADDRPDVFVVDPRRAHRDAESGRMLVRGLMRP